MKSEEILFDLGFNRLETDVYIHLLTHLPSTAYKIGKELNKPTANVYKAIDSLAKKGAVIVEDNRTKLCKAVSPDEFLGHYENSIIEKTKSAKELLTNLQTKFDDEKSYSINSVPLVFERFNSMMSRSKKVVVIDAFPKALEKVIDSIEAATKRGIEVFVESYQPIEIKGADVTCATMGNKALSHWESQQLNVIIDGEEHLIALMDNDLKKVKQAVWSNNTYMSCMLFAGFLREQTVLKIMAEVNNPDFESITKQLLEKQKFFYNSNIPGFDKLAKK